MTAVVNYATLSKNVLLDLGVSGYRSISDQLVNLGGVSSSNLRYQKACAFSDKALFAGGRYGTTYYAYVDVFNDSGVATTTLDLRTARG